MPSLRNLRQFSPFIVIAFAASAALSQSQATVPETSPNVTPQFAMRMYVPEVTVTFNVADAQGRAVPDLQLSDFRVFDDGQLPKKVLGFYREADLPIRAGFVIDTSESMAENVRSARATSSQYLTKLLDARKDEAFVMNFAYASEVTQDWSGDPKTLIAGIQKLPSYSIHIRGTSMFDALYRACLNQFGHTDQVRTGNFILLFSDGEDNTGHTTLEQVVDLCQKHHTAIYAFRNEHDANSLGTGPRILAQLAAETGGRVFTANASGGDLERDLQMIESEQRNQYRLVYQPADLKHDGSFLPLS